MTTAVAPGNSLPLLVTRLALAAGLDADHDEVLRRVDELELQADPRARFESAARLVGLRCTRVLASVKGLGASGRALPALAPAEQSGVAGYVVVNGVRRRGLRQIFDLVDVDGERLELTDAELAARLGIKVDDAIEWLVVESALPMTPMSSAEGHTTPVGRVRALLRLERRDLAVVVTYGVVVGLVSLATPLAVQGLVSTVAFGNLLQPLIVLSIIVVLALAVGGAMRTLQLYVVEILQRRLFVRLISDLAWRLPRVDFAQRDQTDGSKLVNRFFRHHHRAESNCDAPAGRGRSRS